MKYIVTGLLRSRTAWTSVFLGCTAHPFNRMTPENTMDIDCFADPAFLLFWEELYDGRKIVVIKRDYDEALQSAVKVFGMDVNKVMPKMKRNMDKMLSSIDCYVVDFDNYDGEALWKHLYPDEEFSSYRYERLSELTIQERKDAYIAPEAIAAIRGVI